MLVGVKNTTKSDDARNRRPLTHVQKTRYVLHDQIYNMLQGLHKSIDLLLHHFSYEEDGTSFSDDDE